MRRYKDHGYVNVDAQSSQAVGQREANDPNRGLSSLHLDAPRSRPRHLPSDEIDRVSGHPSHRRRLNRTENPVGSPTRDSVEHSSPASVMPTPSQRRLNRSATAPQEERRHYSSVDDDLHEEDRLALVRRHSESLESPTRSRARQHRYHAETESESESVSQSEDSQESEDSERTQDDPYLSDALEEADNEAPVHRRRRSNGKDVLRRRNRSYSRSRDGNSSRSLSDDENNHHRQIIVRDDRPLSRRSDYDDGPSQASHPRPPRASAKTAGGHQPRHSPQRAHKRGDRHTSSAIETSRGKKISTEVSSRSSSSVMRPTNVLSGFLKTSTPPRKHPKHGSSGSTVKGVSGHSERVECVICLSDASLKRSALLKCGHHMCHSCLKRAFILSVEDSAHMPPKCCTKDHIQPKHVERLFDLQFKKTWNRKFVEYTTKNRLYCPAKRCGHFIKPSRIKGEKGRKYARCGHCDTKVCARCNNRWHKTVDCPQDQSINDFLAQAKEEGWQRCYECRAMVELREGCNHMTCRCGAEFCMICGVKWKGCDCPWFNDEAIAADRRLHMHEGPPPPRGALDDIFNGDGPPMPPDLRGMPAFGMPPIPIRAQPQGYPHEGRVDVRHVHSQAETDLSRRMPTFGNFDGDYGAYDMHSGTTVIAAGSSAPHHTNYHYLRGSHSMISSSMPPLSTPYDRGSVVDYVSDVSRARGVREDSMERRLAERLASRPTASPPSVHLSGGPPMSHHMSGLPAYSYAGLPTHGGIDPATGMPMLVQSYSYSTPPMAMDARYSAMQSSPSHLSMPSYEWYEPHGIEVNTPRRRRRAHERERDRAAAERVRRSSSSSSSAVAVTTTEVKSSSLAGLTGPGRGMDRVAEWSYHVSPGMPARAVGDGR